MSYPPPPLSRPSPSWSTPFIFSIGVLDQPHAYTCRPHGEICVHPPFLDIESMHIQWHIHRRPSGRPMHRSADRTHPPVRTSPPSVPPDPPGDVHRAAAPSYFFAGGRSLDPNPPQPMPIDLCMPPVAGWGGGDMQFRTRVCHVGGVGVFRQIREGGAGYGPWGGRGEGALSFLLSYFHTPLHVLTKPAFLWPCRQAATMQWTGSSEISVRRPPPALVIHHLTETLTRQCVRSRQGIRGGGGHMGQVASSMLQAQRSGHSCGSLLNRWPSTCEGRTRPRFRGGNSDSHACSLTFWPSIVAL